MSPTDSIFPSGSNSGGSRGETRPNIAERIEKATRRFESAWKSGNRPRLEDYLVDFEDYEQPALLFELLRIEAKCRAGAGEKLSTSEYLVRFPKHESALRRALSETIREDGETLPPSNAKPDSKAAAKEKPGPAPNEVTTDAYVTRTIQREAPKAGENDAAFTAAKYIELSHHDSGGLGDVFRARDEELGRDVAIKAIQKRLINNPMVTDQFHVEVKVTSRLDHPGIVPVYGMGKFPDGRHFFVMRFIDGVNFRTAIKAFHATDWKTRPRSEYRGELNRLLGHFAAACHTLAYAHNRGVVHRDVKPQNIMLGRFQETLVVDWGLAVPVQRDEKAKASGEKTVMPRMGDDSGSTSGGTAGTLGYMSPEQFQDADAPLGPASDIYSLGATLYHVLTGSAPHQGSSLTETSKVIRTGDFPPPTRINKAVPKPLESICLKAMALKPQDRYLTATALAKEVQNWMTGERVEVYKESLVERLFRSAHHHQSWTIGLGIACSFLFLLAVLSSIFMTQAAKREAQMRLSANEMRDESLQQSAMFAAQTIEANIDRRWRILEYYAEDPALPALILDCKESMPGSEAYEEMQDWLNDVFLEVQTGEPDTTWFITDSIGRQIARVPEDSTNIGKPFAHRDYFHGQGLDLEPAVNLNESERPKPTDKPILSNVYKSTVKGSGYRVGFSVPVYARGRKSKGDPPIAVLAMSVKTGAFQVLHNAMLIDLRQDKIGDAVQRGLILQHEKLLNVVGKSENVRPPHLEQTRFNELEEGVMDLVEKYREGSTGSGEKQLLAKLLKNYSDPLDPTKKGIAAYAPVIVPQDGAGAEPLIPWVVVVPQEDENASQGSR